MPAKKKHSHLIYPICEALLRERRRQEKMQKVLADELHFNPMTLGRWERGESIPSLPSLIRWCAALNVKITVEPKT